MKEPNENTPLHPFDSMELSEAFKHTARLHGYNTLEDILTMPLTELVQKDWFTSSMFEELAALVKNRSV